MNTEQGIQNIKGQKLYHSLFLVQYSIFNYRQHVPNNNSLRTYRFIFGE
ncbi:MAG: hypothetical protein GW788_09570 [Ignavibacteria bacterium]|nr:hypothetical protein [Ignavibacteria bacterium]